MPNLDFLFYFYIYFVVVVFITWNTHTNYDQPNGATNMRVLLKSATFVFRRDQQASLKAIHSKQLDFGYWRLQLESSENLNARIIILEELFL